MRPSGWALIQSDLCPYQSRKVWEFPGSLVVRILGFHCLGPSSTPGWGTEIPQATWCSQKERKVGHTPGMHACTEERPHEETEDSRLQVKGKDLRKSQVCQHLDLGLPEL